MTDNFSFKNAYLPAGLVSLVLSFFFKYQFANIPGGSFFEGLFIGLSLFFNLKAIIDYRMLKPAKVRK